MSNAVKAMGAKPSGPFRSFSALCAKINGHIEAVPDIPYWNRLEELILPAPAPMPMDRAGAMAWLSRTAPIELPRSILRAAKVPAKPYGDVDLFAKLSEWNIPEHSDPVQEAMQAKRWGRWHAEAAGLSAGLSA